MTCKTFKNQRSIARSTLIGSEFEESIPSLVVRNGSDGLRICGETFIEGTAYLPNKRVDRSYIGGKNYTNSKLVYGKIEDNRDVKLPLAKVFENVSIADLTGKIISQPFNPKDTTVSFLEKGIYYQSLNAIQLNGKLHGKIIVQSFDSLVVYPEAELTNVILIAPKIVFKEGFRGSLQAYASEYIQLENSVTLSYPSTLILNELNTPLDYESHTVYLGSNSSVIGGTITSLKDDKVCLIKTENGDIIEKEYDDITKAE